MRVVQPVKSTTTTTTIIPNQDCEYGLEKIVGAEVTGRSDSGCRCRNESKCVWERTEIDNEGETNHGYEGPLLRPSRAVPPPITAAQPPHHTLTILTRSGQITERGRD